MSLQSMDLTSESQGCRVASQMQDWILAADRRTILGASPLLSCSKMHVVHEEKKMPYSPQFSAVPAFLTSCAMRAPETPPFLLVANSKPVQCYSSFPQITDSQNLPSPKACGSCTWPPRTLQARMSFSFSQPVPCLTMLWWQSWTWHHLLQRTAPNENNW